MGKQFLIIRFVAGVAGLTIAANGLVAPAWAQRIALVVGAGAYVDALALPNPPNDARGVAAALRRIGFSVEEAIDVPGDAARSSVGLLPVSGGRTRRSSGDGVGAGGADACRVGDRPWCLQGHLGPAQSTE
jgi:hypothetical protein